MAVRGQPTEGRRSLAKDKRSILHHAGSRRGPSLLDIKSFTEIFRPDGDSQQLKRKKQELVQSYLEQSLPEQEGRQAPPHRKRPRSALRHATQGRLPPQRRRPDGGIRAPPPSLTLLHIGASSDQYLTHERVRPVLVLCNAQLGKHNVEEMEAAYCDVRLMANQLEDQLSRALELRRETGDAKMPVDVVKHILRNSHLGIDEAELTAILQRMVERQSVGHSHGEVDYQSILTALRPHVWNDLMTKRIGSQNTAYFVSPHAELRHGAVSRPSSRDRQGGSQHAEHSEDNATREQAQDEQGRPLFVSPRVMDMLPAILSLRLEQADGDIKGKKGYINLKDLARDTPHCLNQHSKASLRELKRELAVAEYGVKMLNEKVKQDVVWVNEHCGIRSTKAKRVCKVYGAEKMAAIFVKLAREAVEYRFVCWKEHHRFCVDQECARQYLRFKACHGMVEVLTTWVHREYRKGFAVLLHEMLRQRGVEREAAAEVVQKHIRGFTVRRRIKHEQEAGAAVTIQKLVRGMSVRWKVRERKAKLQRQRSAEVIQKHYCKFVRRRCSQQDAKKDGGDSPEADSPPKCLLASADVPTSPETAQQKLGRKPTAADEKKKRAEAEWRARSEEKRKAKEDAKNKAVELKAVKEKREADAREQARKRAAMLATASRERKEKEAAQAAARAESTESVLAAEAEAQTEDNGAADRAASRTQSLQRVQAGRKKVGHVREKSATHEPLGRDGGAADKAASRIQSLTRGHSARKKLGSLKAAKGESTAQILIDEVPDADQQPHTARDPVPTPDSEPLEPEDHDSNPLQEPEPQHEQAPKAPLAPAIDTPPPERPTLNMQVIDSTYTVPIPVNLRSPTAEEARSIAVQKPPTVMDKIAAFFSMLSPGRKRDTEQSPSSASRGLGFLGMRTPQSELSPSGTRSPALSPSVTRYFCFLSPKAAREDVPHVPVSPSAPTERAVAAMGLESRQVAVKASDTGPLGEDVRLQSQQPITLRVTDGVHLNSPPQLAATPHPCLPPSSASSEDATVQPEQLSELESDSVHPQQQTVSSPANGVEGPASRVTSDATAARPQSPVATTTDGTTVRPATPSPAETADNRPMTPQTATTGGHTRPSTATQGLAMPQLDEAVPAASTVDDLPVTEARVTAGEMGSADILNLDDQAVESIGRADEPDVTSRGTQVPVTATQSTSDLTSAHAEGSLQVTGAVQIRHPPKSEAPVMPSSSALRDTAPVASATDSVKSSDRGLSCLTQEDKPASRVEKEQEKNDVALSFSPMAWQPAPTPRPTPPHPTERKTLAAQLPEITGRPGTAPREDRQQSQTPQYLTAAEAMAVGVAGVIHQAAAPPLSSSVSTVTTASIGAASAAIAHQAATADKRPSTPELSKPTAQRPSTPPPRPMTPPSSSPPDRPPTAQTRPSNPQPPPPSTQPPRPQSASSRSSSAAPSSPAFASPTGTMTQGTEADKPAVQTITRDQVAGAFRRSFSPAADRVEPPQVSVVHHVEAQVPASAEGAVVKHVPTEAAQPMTTAQRADTQQQQPQPQEASTSSASSATIAPPPVTAPQPHRTSSTYVRTSISTRASISVSQAAEKPTDEFAGLSPEERALKAEQISMQRKALAAEEAKRKEAERIEAKRLAEEEKKCEAAAKKEHKRLAEQERYRQNMVEEERKRLEHLKAEDEARAKQERQEAEKLERKNREQKEAAERAKRAEEEKKTQVKLKSMQIRSAAKLQRLFRGHRVRRLIHLRRAAIKELQGKVARIVLRAVVRIQRIARGYIKRRWYAASVVDLVRAREERAERRKRAEEERVRREMEAQAQLEAAAAAAAAADADAKALEKLQEQVERRPSVGGRSVEMTEEMQQKLEKLQQLEELEKKLKEREEALQEAERKLQETSSQLRVTPIETETALVAKTDGGEIVPVMEAEQDIVERNDDRQLGEWLEYWDDEAQSYYYYNPRTEEASWTVPNNTARSLISTSASNSVVAADDKASGRWIEQWDDVNQLPYWYNEDTGEASWTNPVKASTEENALQPYLQHPEEWVSYWDEKTGNEYWYNVRTGEASWQ